MTDGTGVTSAMAPADLIDLDRYRLLVPKARAGLVEECGRHLAKHGFFTLPGFVRADALSGLVAEAMATRPLAFRRDAMLPAYAAPADGRLDADDPRRILTRSTNSVVAGDHLEPQGAIQRVYRWDGLTRFIADVVGAPVLHRVADPLLDCILWILDRGDTHHWHFDSNTFVVTLLLQSAEAGGCFEFAPHIRSDADENRTAVSAVLRGERSRVRTVEIEPGTLMLFSGRHALHRVSEVEGRRPRIIAVFSYDEKPGFMFPDAAALRVFGRHRQTQAT
jgi:hypothetical protein